MRQIGTIAANARGDRLACLGMIANSARQAEKLYRPFKVKVFTGNIPWNAGAHRLPPTPPFALRPATAPLPAPRSPARPVGTASAPTCPSPPTPHPPTTPTHTPPPTT